MDRTRFRESRVSRSSNPSERAATSNHIVAEILLWIWKGIFLGIRGRNRPGGVLGPAMASWGITEAGSWETVRETLLDVVSG